MHPVAAKLALAGLSALSPAFLHLFRRQSVLVRTLVPLGKIAPLEHLFSPVAYRVDLGPRSGSCPFQARSVEQYSHLAVGRKGRRPPGASKIPGEPLSHYPPKDSGEDGSCNTKARREGLGAVDVALGSVRWNAKGVDDVPEQPARVHWSAPFAVSDKPGERALRAGVIRRSLTGQPP